MHRYSIAFTFSFSLLISLAFESYLRTKRRSLLLLFVPATVQAGLEVICSHQPAFMR